MDIIPTQEQLHAISAFSNGKNLRINAFAGTGKTATLKMMAHSSKRNGIYLAFNKAIANEAKQSFPDSVEVLTSHALAFRAVIKMGYSKSKMLGRLNAKATAMALKLPTLSSGEHAVGSADFGFLVCETVRNFAYSDKQEITPDLVLLPDFFARIASKHKREVQVKICDQAIKMWSNMVDPDNDYFPLGHDGYFKVWSLSRPILHADFILLDEAQDSNPALLNILAIQQAQIVFVGDRFQQIYAWRGAISTMEENSIEQSLSLTHSFRFGDTIANFATKVANLLDPYVVIHGLPNMESKFGCISPDIIISRTNASLISYLMESLESGLVPFILGGVSDLRWMLEDVSFLKSGLPSTHSEFIGFKTWHDIIIFSEQSAGTHLRPFVQIVENYDEIIILKALDGTAKDEQRSDLILSTAHKAKGREWPSVLLAEDFPSPTEVTKDNESDLVKKGYIFVSKQDVQFAFFPEEIRILYVASTRAKYELHIPEWCISFFDVTEFNEPPTPFNIAERKGMKNRVKTKREENAEKPKEKAISKNNPNLPLKLNRYAVIDFETTGLSPKNGDRALEIGVAIIENGNVIDTYQSLMNPGVKVPEFITGLTGITQKMISKAPSSKAIMREVYDLVSDTWIVAHNASFDKRFWEFELNKIGIISENNFLCTMLISRRIYPWANNYKLETLVKIYNIKVNGQHHRALADSLMAADLFIQIQKDIGSLYVAENITPNFLLAYQKKTKSKLKSAPEKVQDVKKSSDMKLRDVVETKDFKNDILLLVSCCENNINDVELDYQEQLRVLNDHYRYEINELKAHVVPGFLKEMRADLRLQQKEEKEELREIATEGMSDYYEELEGDIKASIESSLESFDVEELDSAVLRMSKRITSAEIRKIKTRSTMLKKERKEKEKESTRVIEKSENNIRSRDVVSSTDYFQTNKWDWIAYLLIAIVILIVFAEWF